MVNFELRLFVHQPSRPGMRATIETASVSSFRIFFRRDLSFPSPVEIFEEDGMRAWAIT